MKIRIKPTTHLAWIAMGFLLSSAFGQEPASQSKEVVARELDELARIATVMVDGDVCQTIMTKRSLEKMFVVDPRDRWAAGDNFEVNYEPYIQIKKTLIRISRLVPYACDVNLWMPFQEKPDKVQILIRNVNEWSQFWTWGVLVQDLPPAMKRVLETGKREVVTQKPGMIAVLAPVYDSLGDTIGLVEVIAWEPGTPAPQVHAKNKDGGGQRLKEALFSDNEK